MLLNGIMLCFTQNTMLVYEQTLVTTAHAESILYTCYLFINCINRNVMVPVSYKIIV